MDRIQWPDGRAFAFTVFDDTDRATVENTAAVYGLLRDCGIHTTKSVWPLAGPKTPRIPGATCDDPAYLALCREIQADGFEIGYHLATYHTAHRDLTRRGLDRFRELFGHDPHTAANHAWNREGIYWGASRFSGVRAAAYRRLRARGGHDASFLGHVEGDPLFWGDLCAERIRYVRNFTFRDVNTLKACPQMPYRDPRRPYVQQWFAGSEGADCASFLRTVTDESLDRLASEGGAA
jgi:hypothetical protein